tara:strand:- start:10 stop:450 length:441 start_codon:yes stop_codon:yes gene_type:complete
MDMIDEELRSTVVQTLKKKLVEETKARERAEELTARAEELAATMQGFLIQAELDAATEASRLEELLNIERAARAVSDARVTMLENRPMPVFPEQKEPDMSPIIAGIAELLDRKQTVVETQKEEPKPITFNVIRNDVGDIMRIVAKQ